MSRNNKNAKRLVKAREVAKMHLNGDKGPAKTTPIHTKKWTYRSNPDLMKKLHEFINGPAETKAEKTAGKKILRGAGKASRVEEVEA